MEEYEEEILRMRDEGKPNRENVRNTDTEKTNYKLYNSVQQKTRKTRRRNCNSQKRQTGKINSCER